MLYSIDQMAGLAAALGEYGRVAVLYAAADALYAEMAISRAADGEEEKQRYLEIIRQQLAPDEITGQQTTGSHFSLEEACAFALNETSSQPSLS